MEEIAIVEKVYELTKKYMNASAIDFDYDVIIRDGPPQIVANFNKWLVYVPPFKRPERFMVNLTQEFAHAFHNLLSEGAYVTETPAQYAVKNIEEANKLLIERAKKMCWEDGIPCRIAEKNLAEYLQDGNKARRTLEEFLMVGDIISPMEGEYGSAIAAGLSEDAAVFNSFRNIVALHYAYLIGYMGIRDLPNNEFYNLLCQKDAHKDFLLPWNNKWDANVRSNLLRLVKAMDYRTKKHTTKKYGITDFKDQDEIRDMVIKNLVK